MSNNQSKAYQNLFSIIAEDFRIYCKAPAYDFRFYCSLFLNLSFHVLLLYRVGHFLLMRRSPIRAVNYLLKYIMNMLSSCHINFSAHIGRRLQICHASGIVIGRDVVIGDDVVIYQHVTLGGEKHVDCSYPTIGNGVILYANCSVIGAVTVGDNAVIGAHSLVLNDIPAGCTAVGIPAKTIKYD